jgi:hypothetical protein
MKTIRIFQKGRRCFTWNEGEGQTYEEHGLAWLKSHHAKGRNEENGFEIRTGEIEEFRSARENKQANYPSHERVLEAIYEKLFEDRTEKFDQIQKEREEVKQRFPNDDR